MRPQRNQPGQAQQAQQQGQVAELDGVGVARRAQRGRGYLMSVAMQRAAEEKGTSVSIGEVISAARETQGMTQNYL